MTTVYTVRSIGAEEHLPDHPNNIKEGVPNHRPIKEGGGGKRGREGGKGGREN